MVISVTITVNLNHTEHTTHMVKNRYTYTIQYNSHLVYGKIQVT